MIVTGFASTGASNSETVAYSIRLTREVRDRYGQFYICVMSNIE